MTTEALAALEALKKQVADRIESAQQTQDLRLEHAQRSAHDSLFRHRFSGTVEQRAALVAHERELAFWYEGNREGQNERLYTLVEVQKALAAFEEALYRAPKQEDNS